MASIRCISFCFIFILWVVWISGIWVCVKLGLVAAVCTALPDQLVGVGFVVVKHRSSREMTATGLVWVMSMGGKKPMASMSG